MLGWTQKLGRQIRSYFVRKYKLWVHLDTHQRCLLGESVREIAVLVFVFVPLNMLLESKGDLKMLYPRWMSGVGQYLSPQHGITIFFALAGIALLHFGIRIESKARAEQRRLKAELRRLKKGDNHDDIPDVSIQRSLHSDGLGGSP
jgi:hypothetical protein